MKERNGKYFVEGSARQALLRDVTDAVKLIEACFDSHTKIALLYAENLTDSFFDLSSLQAGEILQKLRNYNIRLALVFDPNVKQLSSAFRDLMIEESRNKYFRLFEDREEAEVWLLGNEEE